jgi:DNA transposition AAA+ family ATPase
LPACKSRTCHRGNAKAFGETAAAWLKREERRIAKIEVLAPARKAAGMARDDSDIAVTAEDSGTGKTAALRSCAAESCGAVLIEAGSGFTKNALMEETAHAPGLETKGSLTAIAARIVEALRGRGPAAAVDGADTCRTGPWNCRAALSTARRRRGAGGASPAEAHT